MKVWLVKSTFLNPRSFQHTALARCYFPRLLHTLSWCWPLSCRSCVPTSCSKKHCHSRLRIHKLCQRRSRFAAIRATRLTSNPTWAFAGRGWLRTLVSCCCWREVVRQLVAVQVASDFFSTRCCGLSGEPVLATANCSRSSRRSWSERFNRLLTRIPFDSISCWIICNKKMHRNDSSNTRVMIRTGLRYKLSVNIKRPTIDTHSKRHQTLLLCRPDSMGKLYLSGPVRYKCDVLITNDTTLPNCMWASSFLSSWLAGWLPGWLKKRLRPMEKSSHSSEPKI